LSSPSRHTTAGVRPSTHDGTNCGCWWTGSRRSASCSTGAMATAAANGKHCPQASRCTICFGLVFSLDRPRCSTKAGSASSKFSGRTSSSPLLRHCHTRVMTLHGPPMNAASIALPSSVRRGLARPVGGAAAVARAGWRAAPDPSCGASCVSGIPAAWPHKGAARSRWGRTARAGACQTSHKTRHVYSTRVVPAA
jgi:hypothetical protein